MGSKPKLRKKPKRKAKAKTPKKAAPLVAESQEKLETSPFPTSDETSNDTGKSTIPTQPENECAQPISEVGGVVSVPITTLKERGPDRRKNSSDPRWDQHAEMRERPDRRQASFEIPLNHIARGPERRVIISNHGLSYTEKRVGKERRIQSEEREGGLLGSAVAESMGPDILGEAPEGAEFPKSNTLEYKTEGDYLEGDSTPPDSNILDASSAPEKPTDSPETPSDFVTRNVEVGGVVSVPVPKSTTPDIDYPPVFLELAKVTKLIEGGYVMHPSDPGGETNFGISKRQYPDEDIKGMTPERATYLMYRDYWKPLKLDKIDDVGVQFELLDSGYNMGTSQAVRLAQNVCVIFGKNIGGGPSRGVDGIIGPQTIQALNLLSKSHPEQLLRAMNGEQYAFYKALVERKPAQYLPFFKGWMLRLRLIGDLNG